MMLALCRHYWRISLPAAVIGVVGLALLAPASGKAPPAPKKAAPAAKNKAYEEIAIGTPDPKEWKIKKAGLMAEGKFSEGPAGEEEEKMFTNHYKLLVAEMTHWNVRDSLHLKRLELKKDLNGYGRAPDQSLHGKLREMMGTFLPKVFENPKFSPAARYNTLVAYGELNSDEGDIGGNGAVPHGKALPVLLSVFKNKDGRYPAYLQFGALAGICRHLTSSKNAITPEYRKELVQALIAWLHNPPEGVSPEVQNFMRRRASDVLRILATRGPEANVPDVVTALNHFAADEEVPLDDRCETIRTLGTLDKKSFPEKSVPAVARTIALLVAEVGRQTPALQPVIAPAAPAEEAADADAAAEPGEAAAEAPADAAKPDDKPAAAVPAVAEADAPAVPDEAPAVKSQNALPPDLQGYFLYCLKSGIEGPGEGKTRGLAGAATAENKQLLGDVMGKLDEMLNVVKKKKHEDKLNEDEIRKLQDLATSVETLIGHKQADADGATEQARAQ